MASLTPVFNGSYTNGPLIYNVTNYAVGGRFRYYIESIELVYDNIYDRKMTGFSDVKYIQNDSTSIKNSGEISITLVGDLPEFFMSQLVQLAKACMGGGMDLLFSDTIMTDKLYTGKWQNAGDFVENNALLCGGNINLRFYQVV